MLKKITYEKDLPAKIEIASISNYPIHMHPDIQLIYVLEGTVDLNLTFKTYRLKKDDFRYIHSEDIHSLRSEDSSNMVLILSVNIEYLEKIFPNIRTAVITMPTDKTLLLYNNQQLQLKYCIFVLLDEFLKRTDGFHSRVKKTLKTIFGIIYREFRGFTVDKENKAFVYKRLQDMRQTERLGEIIDDIYKNYVEPSTLEEIASRQNLNPYYLSHLFSQTIGINYRDFINMVRVETSEYDLLTSDLSISHIALSSGFSNSSYYNKHFAFWFGMPPQEYRKKYIGKTISKMEPAVKMFEISDFAAIIRGNLDILKTASVDFPTEPVSQTIRIDQINFDTSLHIYPELACHNPDLLDVSDVFFSQNELLTPDFVQKYFSSVKIIIDSHSQKKDSTGSTDMYGSIKNILDNIVTRHRCRFNMGLPKEDESIHSAEFIKTPLYYLLRFFAQDYDAIYIDTYYVLLKAGSFHHILCWNLNLTHSKELIVKSDTIPAGSLVTISKINLTDYPGYLAEIRRIHQCANCDAPICETLERILDQRLFSQETAFLTESSLNILTHLQSQSLCFISILPGIK